MIQEIITTLIVALAVFLAVKKIRKKLNPTKKKKQEESTAGKSGATSKCGTCTANCIFRDAPESVLNNNHDACPEKTSS